MTEYRKRRRGRRQYRPSEKEKERIRFRLDTETADAAVQESKPPSEPVVGRLVRAAPEAQRAFPARQMIRKKPGE